LIQSAKENTSSDFLAIWGQEVSTISAGNHFNIFFANEICNIEAGDFKTLYEEWLPAHPEVPFIQFNHPDYRADQRPTTKPKERNNDYGIDDYDGDFDRLVQAGGPHVALIELIVGPAFSSATNKPHQQGTHEADYIFYLNKGFRLAPSCGQDNHKRTWGTATHARMGVWATALTRAAWIEAINNRRCYATEDESLEIRFSVNDSIMGSTIDLGDSGTARISISLRDDNEADARYRVKLFYDNAVGGPEATIIENVRLDQDVHDVEFLHIPDPGGYYFVKVTQESNGTENHNDDAWTAPVWVNDGTAVHTLAANTDDPEKDEINWDEAKNYLGKTITVSGRIVRTFNYRGRIVFFNYDADFENTLTLILLRDDFAKFGGAQELQERLANKHIKVRGTVSLYNEERLQLRLSNPDQIVTVSD
jgi:hypothetical protein